MATHSSVALAWRIPGTGEPGELLCMGLQRRTRLKQLSSSSSYPWEEQSYQGQQDPTYQSRNYKNQKTWLLQVLCILMREDDKYINEYILINGF